MARNTRIHRYCFRLGLILLASSWLPLAVGCRQATDTSSSPSTTQASPSQQPPATSQPASIDESVDVDGLLAARLSQEELDFGWFRLFDGQSLMGWKATSKANWRVEDGCIAVDAGDQGFLFTTSRFSDFEFTLEFLADERTNSGVFLRSPTQPTSPARDCYELNIAPPDNPFPTGSLVERIRADSEQVGELEPEAWHQLHALVDGQHVRIWVDGREAADYVDQTPLTAGYIGLQFREGAVRFRELKLRPITYAVLPTEELKDWNLPKTPNFDARLSQEGGLRLRGDKGHVELLQSHANFCLQAKVKTLAENVNSGIFFRCLPGQAMNGYECQVHHGFHQDRRVPVDAGMGAIFRRQAARAVLSDADRSAHLALIADGLHLATWVEGIQVVDWTDERPVHENPRQGARTEAGTIQLQSHDPTCDVLFESLSISPLP
jgi:hypothetical protein